MGCDLDGLRTGREGTSRPVTFLDYRQLGRAKSHWKRTEQAPITPGWDREPLISSGDGVHHLENGEWESVQPRYRPSPAGSSFISDGPPGRLARPLLRFLAPGSVFLETARPRRPVFPVSGRLADVVLEHPAKAFAG